MPKSETDEDFSWVNDAKICSGCQGNLVKDGCSKIDCDKSECRQSDSAVSRTGHETDFLQGFKLSDLFLCAWNLWRLYCWAITWSRN
jgi:hypothetical protein